MAVTMLTLPRRSHLSADVLLTHVAMCSSGHMRGAKNWTWEIYAARSKSLMVDIHLGFLSVSMWARMVVLNVSRHTCHSHDGL